MTPAYIRQAAKIIDRWFFAPRRRRKLMEARGCDELCTKFELARRQHRSTRAIEKVIAAQNRALLEREVWNANLS